MSFNLTTMSKPSCRRATGQYPARVILLDISPPFEISAGRLICDALEHFLCVSSSMAGISKIPLFGIYVLTTYPEMVLPLSQVKGNFVRVYKALQDIRGLLEESVKCSSQPHDTECLTHGMMEACKQLQRYAGNTQQSSLSFHQLEIVVLTAQKGDFVQKHLKNLPNQVDLSLLKRILCVTIQRNVLDECSNEDVITIDDDPDMAGENFNALVDVLSLDCDEMSIQRFFYSWLSETLSETEHLQLLLPAPSAADTELLIKCDILEKMINPCQLPCHSRFSLEPDASLCKHVYPPPSKAIGMMIPIHKLKAVHGIPRSQLCESVLFGFPLVLVPTTCWTVDWEELDQNQSNFNALCDELMKKDQVLLLQLYEESSTKTSSTSNLKANLTSGMASGYFIVIPSERNLVIKSVIAEELFLPSSRQQSIKQTSIESELRVQSSLSQLSLCDDYSPLSHSTGLFEALKISSLPKSTIQKQWNQSRKNVIMKKNQTSSMARPMVPSPPKFAKTSAEPGRKHTATVWSNPLSNVVKKSNKSSFQGETSAWKLDFNTSKSWKSGFVED